MLFTNPGIGRPSHGQRAPYEYNEAVEMWARTYGRHGWVEYNQPLDCWVIHLTKRPEDPMLKAWKEGTLDQPNEPTECVPLHRRDEKSAYGYVPLHEYGVSGVIEVLNKGNTWSGRGEFKDIVDGLKKTREHNDKVREGMKRHAWETGAEMAHGARRTAYNLPMVGNAGIPSLTTPTEEKG